MSTKTLRSRALRAATVAAVAIGVSVGVTSPAHALNGPAFGPVTLNITEVNAAYQVPVTGIIPMSQTAAQNYINAGAHIQVVLWGDDGSARDNDKLFVYDWAWMSAQGDGLHWSINASISGSVANEDSGFTWLNRHEVDELFAVAQFKNGDELILSEKKSNTVTGTF